MILGEYRAPWQEREIKPEMGDVYVARVDVFEVGSCVSKADLAAFELEGQPHLPWKICKKVHRIYLQRLPSRCSESLMKSAVQIHLYITNLQ